MTVQELEQQLLSLPPSEKLRLIQLLAQSLNHAWTKNAEDSNLSISEFFRQSPLAEAAATGELDLSRDYPSGTAEQRSHPVDRFTP